MAGLNILLISHQLDYTGAPIALWHLARALLEQGHEVSMLSKKPGAMSSAFSKLGVKPVNRDTWRAQDLYVANTLLSIPWALKLSPNPQRVLAWIHEARSLMRYLRQDAESLGLRQLRHACFPSQFQIQEYQALMPECDLRQLMNMTQQEHHMLGQPSRPSCVVTGPWNRVKNQDTLLSLMASAQLELHLDFVGALKPPHLVDAPHQFHGQVAPHEARRLIASASGLISTSINETQNLSAIESIMAGKPVLLSQIPAHQELKQHMPDIVLFDLNDPTNFAQGFQTMMWQSQQPALLERMQKQAQTHFGAQAFSKRVRALVSSVVGP